MIVCSFLVADAFGYEERNIIQSKISLVELRSNLVLDRTWIPYPAYADREGWNVLTGKHRQDIIGRGEQYLTYQWKVIAVSDYLRFNVTGDRACMETPYYANFRALSALLGAELAEGQGRFLPKIADGIYYFCEMSSWALSAHISKFSGKADAMPLEGDRTLELGQGDLCQLLSWAHWFLADELDKIHPAICDRLRREIKYRELDPYLERDDYWWMGFRVNVRKEFLNNWTPWCNANALICFMLMEDDPGRLCQAVWKSIRSVDLYMNFISSDGGIEEGSTYWASSAGMLYNYLNILHRITGGAASVFDNPMIMKMGEFFVNSYVGDGWMVNFADASAKWNYSNIALLYGYGKDTGSRLLQDFAIEMRTRSDEAVTPGTNFNRFLETLYLYREMDTAGRSGLVMPSYICYPETGFHFERNARGLFLAVATGNNGQSHNHNDTGSFILYADNTPLILDVGVGTYTKQTFGPQRYKIWTMQSAYHNLPLINGTMQEYGKKYAARNVRSMPGRLCLDIAGCYPEDAHVKSWLRTYELKDRSLKISDGFNLENADQANEIVFMAWGQPSLAVPGLILLHSAEHKAELKYSERQFDASIEQIELTDPKLARLWGENLYRIILKARTMQRKGRYVYEINL